MLRWQSSRNTRARRPRRPDEEAAGLDAQRKRLPDQPGVYVFKDADGGVLYVGKALSIRKRVASHFSGPHRGGLEFIEPGRLDRLPGHRDGGRGAARRAAVHQAPPAPLQHPPARRQVLSVHRGEPGRGVSARLLHPRAPPLRAGLLRAVLQRTPGARDARPARQAVPVPDLRGAGARAAIGGSVPRLLHQALPGALRRLHRPRGVPAQHRGDHRLPLRPLSRRRARPGAQDGRGRRRRGVRAGGDLSRPPRGGPLADAAPQRRRGVAGDRRPDRGRHRRARRQRPGVPGPRRRARRAPRLLPRQRGGARRGRGDRGVRRPVLLGGARGAAAGGRGPRAAGPRRAARGGAVEPPWRPGRGARRRARRQAAAAGAGRAQRPARPGPGQAAGRAAPPAAGGRAGRPAGGARPGVAARADRGVRRLQPGPRPHRGLDGRVRGRRAEEGRLPPLQGAGRPCTDA